MKLQLPKGTQDIKPEEKILRDEVVGTLKRVFERYGFSPLETPIIERYETLSAKYGGGSEILKETFRLKDRGGRSLGLRFDLTIPLARFVGMNPNLKMPFKRYQIGLTYRDGPIKLGRLREFYQCDVDTVGTENMLADAEMIKLTLDIIKELGLEGYVEVNNRKLLNGILEYADVDKNKRLDAIIIIDKLKKVGIGEVKKELRKIGLSKESIKRIDAVLGISDDYNYKKILKKLKKIIKNKIGVEGIKELEELFSYFGKNEIRNIKLNISLARGLAYYTGPVFEAFLKKSLIKSAIAGGGRYDEMIGLYLGGRKKIPATGISLGLEPIIEAIKLKRKIVKKTNTKVYVIPIKTLKESLKVIKTLRRNNINSDIDLVGRGISKNLSYANSLNIPFVIIIGKEETKNKKIKLRNMKTGRERLLTIKEVVKLLKK